MPPSSLLAGSNTTYRPHIDGLRALAIVMVVLYHAFAKIFVAGFVGVDIFFVISGFVITNLILTQLNSGTFNIVSFYNARICRLLPSLLTVILCLLALGYVCFFPAYYKMLANQIFFGLIFVSNIRLSVDTDYFSFEATTQPLLHLWSLALEMQFYCIWPFLLWAGHRLWSQKKQYIVVLLSICCLLSFAYAIQQKNISTYAAFGALGARFWQFAVGGLVALALPYITRYRHINYAPVTAWLFLGIMIAIICFVNSQTDFIIWTAAASCAVICFIISTEQQAHWLSRIFSARPIVAIGKISYPLYLWHWPIFVSYNILEIDNTAVLPRLFLIVLSIVCAILTERFIERPFRRKIHVVTKVRILVVAAILLLGTVLFIAKKDGLIWRYNNSAIMPIAQSIGYFEPYIPVNTLCVMPNTHNNISNKDCNHSPSVVLWGDSHAAYLEQGLLHLVPYQFKLQSFTWPACPPLLDINTAYTPTCAAWNLSVINQLQKISPKVLIIFSYWDAADYTRSYNDIAIRLKNTFDYLQQKIPNTTLVVLGPAPRWTRSPQLSLLHAWNQSGDAHLLSTNRLPTDTISELDRLLQNITQKSGHVYISVSNILCNSDGCLLRFGDGVADWTSFDYGHLSNVGANYVWRQVLPKIEQYFIANS